MRMLNELIRRNIKLFFKDKGLFFSSLITPLILFLLYVTFLGRLYKQTFENNLPSILKIPEQLIDGLVGGQLLSSIIAVSCITVSFCANILMVQDKVSGSIRDIKISPVKSTTISLSYFISSYITSLIICLISTGLCLGYVALVGWYYTAWDVVIIVFDVILLVLFGTALSSVINHCLKSQGQMSSVSTIISTGYGFICGAYMPISQFSDGLQKVLSFLPSTYASSIIRNHSMTPMINMLYDYGVSTESVKGIMDAYDCNIYLINNQVSIPIMYVIVGVSTLLLITTYILQNKFSKIR